MNDTPSTPPTMESTVEEGAAAFEKAEQRCVSTANAIGKLSGVFLAANGLGMMGYLQTQRMIADVETAAGLIAHARAILFALHREATSIAIEHNVDIPIVAGGGPR